MMSGWVSFGANAAIGSGLVVPNKLPVPSCTGNIDHVFVNESQQIRWVTLMSNIFMIYFNLFAIMQERCKKICILIPINILDFSVSYDFYWLIDPRMLFREANVFPLYRLSYHWVAPIGTLVVLVIGGLVTWITGATDPSSIDKNLLSPVIHRYNRLIWQFFVTIERNITFDLQMVTSTEISKWDKRVVYVNTDRSANINEFIIGSHPPKIPS